MADAKNPQPDEDDGALLAVEATEPVILQEPDRPSDTDGLPEGPAVAAPRKPEKRQSGLLGFVIGGAVLAGAGFGVAKYAFPETESIKAIAALQAQLDASFAKEAALQAEVTALAERPLADTGLVGRVAAVEAAIPGLPDTAAIDARLTELEDRLAAIEAASAAGDGGPAAAIAAMDREMKDLRAQLDAQQGADPALVANLEAATSAAQSRLDAAEKAAVAAARQAAISHLRAAFQSGEPLGPALQGLTAMGAEIPAALAETGDALPSLPSLQDGFAAPARAALDASIRAERGEGWVDRLTAFLRTQSGARSLTPREGADPDAVLSRAEAALRDGQIAVALSELAGLPPAGAEAMSAWIADATRRWNAEQAIDELSETLNGQ